MRGERERMRRWRDREKERGGVMEKRRRIERVGDGERE